MFKKNKKGQNYAFKSFLTSFILTILLYVSYSYGFFYGIENFFEDILFREKPVDSRILIVSIDNESISKIGQWPWPRSVFARALINLDKIGPSSVGFDVIMPEDSRFGREDDLTLSDALNSISYPISIPVEAKYLEINKGGRPYSNDFLFPIDSIKEGKLVNLAHVNLITDKDGVVRRLPFVIEDKEGAVYRSLLT